MAEDGATPCSSSITKNYALRLTANANELCRRFDLEHSTPARRIARFGSHSARNELLVLHAGDSGVPTATQPVPQGLVARRHSEIKDARLS